MVGQDQALVVDQDQAQVVCQDQALVVGQAQARWSDPGGWSGSGV